MRQCHLYSAMAAQKWPLGEWLCHNAQDQPLFLFFFVPIVAISSTIFVSNGGHCINGIRRGIATSHHKLIERSYYCHGIVVAAGVIDFLVGTKATNGALVRETMGKGNSIDKGHGKKVRLLQGSGLRAKRQLAFALPA
jgi:hypothetical protein